MYPGSKTEEFQEGGRGKVGTGRIKCGQEHKHRLSEAPSPPGLPGTNITVSRLTGFLEAWGWHWGTKAR